MFVPPIDKVLVTAVKDLAHTSFEHVLYFKLEKAATVRTTVFLSVGVFWSWFLVLVLVHGIGVQLVLGDGSNSYLLLLVMG